MKTYTYYIYHIDGVKIGCTTELERRMRKQGFTEWEILWQQDGDYEFGWIAGDKELELQKEYGLPVDACHYQITRGNSTSNTLETRSKISESLKGHNPWNVGTARKEETKRKISETLTGIPLSEERKKAIGDSLRGKSKPKTKCPKCGNMVANNMFERHINRINSCA